MAPFSLRSLALLITLAAASSAAAQPDARFDNLGTDDGLSQSIVNAIVQDRQGYLWFGTEDGLNRYDGARFAVYRYVPDDSTALPGNRVTALAEDSTGALWVGTTDGLARLDRPTEAFAQPAGAPGAPDGECGTEVTALVVGAEGTLWSATRNGGLCTRDPASGEWAPVRVQPVPEIQSGALALFRGARGALWAHLSGIGAEGGAGVCRIDEAQRTCEVADVPWTRSVPGAPGVAFGDTPNGLALYRREGDSWSASQTWPGVRMVGGSRNVLVASGRIWVATEANGILNVDPETGDARFYEPDPADPRSVPSATIKTFYRDAQGTIWIGTALGLSRWRPPETGAFQVVTRGPGGLSTNGVNNIHQGRDGRVWIATNDGLNELDPETGAVIVHRRAGEPGESFPSAFWWVYEDDQGTLWVGAKRQGLFRFDRASGQFSRASGLTGAIFGGSDSPRVPVRFVTEDREHRLWLGTSDGLAVRPEVTGRWNGFTPTSDALPSTHTNVVFEDSTGALWVGTDGGLCRFVPALLGEIRAMDCYRHVPGEASTLGADIVWTVAEDARGQLWAGTIGGGLARFDAETESWSRVTTADGLPNNTIYGLLPDDQGRLWMTTNAGLAAYDVASGAVSVYTVADGLPSNEFDFMAYHRGRDGTMYVGGPHGLTYFHPDRLAPTGDVAPVVISGVRVNDVRRPGLVESGDGIEVAHDENFLRFEFASLDFRNPEQNRYEYRLRGYENEWRETDGRQPFAVYTRVPPGAYTFEVRGANRDGVFNPEPVEIGVRVVPSLLQRAWFKGLLALLVVGGLGFVAMRVHQGRLRRDRLEELRQRRRLAHRLHTGPVPALRRVGEDLHALASGDENHPTRAVRVAIVEVTDGLVTVVEELGPPEWDEPG